MIAVALNVEVAYIVSRLKAAVFKDAVLIQLRICIRTVIH